MATYAAPSGATIRGYSRLNGMMFGIADAALETLLAAQVADGEDGVFGRIGESYETADLTARQLRYLQRAVSHRTAATFLWELEVRRVSGTHEPLLIDDSVEIGALAEANEQRAQEQESLLRGQGETVNTPVYAMPSFGSSTFSGADTDRTPSERLDLIDERDNVSSWDTADG